MRRHGRRCFSPGLAILRRLRYIILGLILFMIVSFDISFQLSGIICFMRRVHTSANGNFKRILATETFNLVEYKRRMWTNMEITRLVIGDDQLRGHHDKHVVEHLSGITPQIFYYIINNRFKCRTSGEISFVLSVLSEPTHFEERMILRKTYGAENLFPRYPSRTVFFLGAVRSQKLQESILEENQKHGDIVQFNFLDTYENLSYKALAQLQWFNEFCANAKYLIKVDDDLYFNMFEIVKVVQQIVLFPRSIVGHLYTASPIYRKSHKWAVHSHLFPKENCFPPYFDGRVYIISNALFSELHNTALRTPVVHLEDVYITGIVAAQLQDVKYIHFNGKSLDPHILLSHPRLAQECDVDCKLLLWCRHLSNLRAEDKELIGAVKLLKLLRNLRCRRFSDGL